MRYAWATLRHVWAIGSWKKPFSVLLASKQVTNVRHFAQIFYLFVDVEGLRK